MNTKDMNALAARKMQILDRLNPRCLPETVQLSRADRRRSFTVSERGSATAFGGAALAAQLIETVGLRKDLDEGLNLLQRHRPYTEADHVLSLAFSAFAGGRCLEALDEYREDAGFLDTVGLQRMPDPTTSGDFLRRFTEADIGLLHEAINRSRLRVWEHLPERQKRVAKIDVDGTLVDTYGECKEGADFNYKGGYGYAPLLVSLANTAEPLYINNRSGNTTSNTDFIPELEAAAELVQAGGFEKVRFRGDSAFAVARHFDGWADRGIEFAFSMTVHEGLEKRLREIPEESWTTLSRKNPKTRSRARQERSKRLRVKERGYKDLRLEREDYVEIEHQPKSCGRSYRLVVVRKTIQVTQGQLELENEVRYRGHITNIPDDDLASDEVVFEVNKRCNQEKLIEQLKNGVAAFTAPVGTLVSNWAWMTINALPLSFKAWLSILHPDLEARGKLARMQYRRFLRTVVTVPVCVSRTARGLSLKLLCYTRSLEMIMNSLLCLRRIRLRLDN